MAPLVDSYVIQVSERANIRTAVNSSTLQTWWHSTGEINTKTAVKNENVRQSHIYSVQVASISAATDFYDSFVYESIPRNGNGNICDPSNPQSVCNQDDQITIEGDIGADMAWTQYLSSGDSVVKITRSDNGSVDPANVIIRPRTLNFKLQESGNALLITIPYSANGNRFSVEFQDNLWQYRNAYGGLDSHYVQNKNPSGMYYVSSYNDSMPVVGVEPLNPLMIFMSPFPSQQYVPDISSPNTYKVTPGIITGLDKVTQSVVYFEPGVYWCTGSARVVLSQSVTWVYLAPGAYVKGAIQYESQSLDLRATGFGVLSGEQYVYQANPTSGFTSVKNTNTMKMWQAQAANGAKWTLHGLTLNAPPFNSMDFGGGDLSTFSVDASDYKQVGAFFGQTDGIEMYPGSHVRNIFYHAGDDVIKTYYSNVLCERVNVWKTCNSPIVQFGWYKRDTSNVTVDTVNVMHTRYISQSTPWPRALIASAANFNNSTSTSDADITMSLSNYKISNWRCEGFCPALLGINPLQNIDTMSLSNIWIEQLSPDTTGVGTSSFRPFTDASHSNQAVALGNNSPNNLGLIIENFMVGNQSISFQANNWQASDPDPSHNIGRLNIDGSFQGRWTVR